MAQPIPIPPSPLAPESGARARARALRVASPRWVDVALLLALAAAGYGGMRAAAAWRSPLGTGERVDLSAWRLPAYAGLSTLRMAAAYLVSLAFSLAYARIAAGSRAAERVMIPMLDILQSIPILSFMPGVILGLAALFPGRTAGLELAAIVLIFTSQAWNLAFSFHQSLITIPRELAEAATVYGLGAWRRFTRLELPFGAIALIANSMMSWAGGWFFLTASEQFTLGDRSFRLPGLGSYIAQAADAGDIGRLLLGLATLVAVIVVLDLLLWRPLVAWSDRFKVEQSAAGDVPRSRVLELLQHSVLLAWMRARLVRPAFRALDRVLSPRGGRVRIDAERASRWGRRSAGLALAVVLAALVLWGALRAAHVLARVSSAGWREVGASTLATFLRTTAALVIATLWTVPLGVRIGLDPRWSRRAQPLVQIAASIPATAIFPLVLLLLLPVRGGIEIAAVALMLLGTQWYVLFNVIAGAMAIPSDLREAATTYRLTGWRRWKILILPAIFPYLVTGMITATGGAWNASIVSEYVTFAGHKVSTTGLGALIARAADQSDFPLLLAGTLVMAAVVIAINRLGWRRLYRQAESRFRLE